MGEVEPQDPTNSLWVNNPSSKDENEPETLGTPAENNGLMTKALSNMDKGGTPGRHRGFHWVETDIGFETMELDAAEVAHNFGVPQRVLKAHIDAEIEDEDMVKSLPMALLLVFFFAFMWIKHDTAELVFGAQKAIEFDIRENANFAFSATGAIGHKALEDVNSYADFWSWMRLGLLPLVVKQDRAVSEAPPKIDVSTLPETDRDFYLWHNRRIGSIRLRQQLAEVIDCPSEDLGDVYGLPCLSQPEGLRLLVGPERHVIEGHELQADDSLTTWIQPQNFSSAMAGVESQALQLEKDRWLNSRTLRIEVSFVTYNGHLDILCKSDVHFLFARTGHIWKQVTHASIRLDPYQNLWVYVADILFYSQITWIFFMEAGEVIAHIMKNRKFMDAMRQYWTVWNFVDWLSVVVGYLMLGVWISQVLKAKDIRETLLANKQCFVDERARLGTSQCSTQVLNDFFLAMTDAKNIFISGRDVAALYPGVLIFRLLKAFSAQPRLAVVTRTIYNAATDLYHFGIAFTAIFLSYCIMGMVLFGRELREFTTLNRSCMTNFRMLMGDFDTESMLEVSDIMVWIYFGTFMVMLLLIMLNMLIAILMDVYSEVKSSVQSSETLFTQVVAIIRRMVENLRKQRVPLKTIQRILEGVDMAQSGETLIKSQEFCDLLPTMKKKQAARLLSNSAKRFNNKNARPPQTSDILRSVALVSKGLLAFLKDAKEENWRLTEKHLKAMECDVYRKLALEGESRASGCNELEPQESYGVHDLASRDLATVAGVGNTSLAAPDSTVLLPSLQEQETEPLPYAGGSPVMVTSTPADLAKEVPLSTLLRAAQLRLEAEVGPLGAWPMAAVSLRFMLDAARVSSTELESEMRNPNVSAHENDDSVSCPMSRVQWNC